jgi:GTPase SAR1 family protein
MTNIKDSKQVKVVLLGDSGTYGYDQLTYSGVGKSSIMLRFVTGNFDADREPTLGGAFMAKIVNFKERSYKYQVIVCIYFYRKIWDTAGQEKYQSLASMYYRGKFIS